MIAAALAAGVRLLCGIVPQWHCDRNARAQRIYFANHSSHLDFVVIWSALPPAARARTRPVAGRGYWHHTRLRRYLAGGLFRAVLIERDPVHSDPAAAASAAVQQMADVMGRDESLILFPEGTRSTTGEIGPFKSGLFHLSRLRPDAELVPVHLENLNRILPKGEALPVPMICRVIFGAPLRCVREDKAAFLATARAALLDLRGDT
jgi:1-acyl-sn-glycerol-3-phosphate acyltransferase